LPVSLHFSRFTEATLVFTKTPFNRRGTEEAHRFTLWAHNSEDIRISGNHYTSFYLQKQDVKLDVKRSRYPRTYDRYVSPVSLHFSRFTEAHINNRYSVNGNTRFTLGSELQDQRLVTGIIPLYRR
jgi:hypothetical protein